MRFNLNPFTAAAVLTLGLTASAASAQTLRFAHVDADDWQSSKKGAAAQMFEQIVEGQSDMTVEIVPAGALGDEDEIVSQVQEGLVRIAMVSGVISKVCKPVAVLDIPYTFSDATAPRRFSTARSATSPPRPVSTRPAS